MSGGRIDLRADLHGRVADFVSDQDRAWFAAHPAEAVRWRPAFPHEFCDPRRLPLCRLAFDPAPLSDAVEATLMVEVRRLAPWFRTRQPYYAIGPREAT